MTAFRCIVAEDEPLAMRAICKIIEDHCPQFQVVATAKHGEEAFELIREHDPELVLTDIEMPLLDGLALVHRVKELKPQIEFVIISGYQHFEYMRTAIQAGVLDYMMKPIVPTHVKETLGRVSETLTANRLQQRNELLQRLCGGKEVSVEQIHRFFPADRYYCGLMRKNGLPGRFLAGREQALYDTLSDRVAVYGRDDREEMFFVPEDLLNEDMTPAMSMRDYLIRQRLQRGQEDAYYTILYYEEAVACDRFTEKIGRLYRSLNSLSVIGRTQVLAMEQLPAPLNLSQSHSGRLLERLLAQLDEPVESRIFSGIEEGLRSFYLGCATEAVPQFWLETATGMMLDRLQAKLGAVVDWEQWRYVMEDTFAEAGHMSEPGEAMVSLIEELLRRSTQPKADSEDFFHEMEAYLQKHLAKDISLPMLARTFAISPTYISKLFRKYGGMSYVQYLKGLRMEEAKRLLSAPTPYLLREVAEMTGFHDQFYFSRIFRSYTGQSPTEFLQAVKQESGGQKTDDRP